VLTAGLRWMWTLAVGVAVLSAEGWPFEWAGPGGEDAPAFAEPVRADSLPVPVLLVPGWGDHAPGLEPFVRRLAEAGWPESRISTLSFRDRVGSNQRNAKEISTAVQVLRGLTGAERVDVVAHSMGGLAVRQYLLEEEGAESVRRVVFLGTPHRGTVAAMLSWGDGGREMVPGSPFLSRLNEAPVIPPGVEALAIRTPVDLRIIPASSARLEGEGVTNLELCCPTHTGLVDDERTFQEVVRFLRRDDASMRASSGG
jgi:triacylglycerol lipase